MEENHFSKSICHTLNFYLEFWQPQKPKNFRFVFMKLCKGLINQAKKLNSKK